MLFTIDASVFVSSCNKNETSHDDSNAFLNLVKRTESLIVEPSLMPVEVAAAIQRGCGNNQLAVEYSEHLFKLPHAIFISLDNDFSLKAIKIASEYSLRGADAIYVATAIQYDSILVSLDKEQLIRAPASLKTCTPKEARKYFPK